MLKDQIIAETLENAVRSLLELYNQRRRGLVYSNVTLTWESKFSAWSHSWLYINCFTSNINFLLLSITLKSKSLKIYGFLASIVELFEGALHSNRQVGEPIVEGIHVATFWL